MSLRDKYTDEEWDEAEKRSKEYFMAKNKADIKNITMKAILNSGIKMKILEVMKDGRYRLLDGDIVTREEIREIIEE